MVVRKNEMLKTVFLGGLQVLLVTPPKELQWEEGKETERKSKYPWRKRTPMNQRPEYYKDHPCGYQNPQELC